MKDIFKERTKNAYWEVMKDFAESLETSFPNCEETNEYVSWVKKFTTEEKDDHINKWFQSLHEPLQKAKYGKAVERITGNPPNFIMHVHTRTTNVYTHLAPHTKYSTN